MCGFQFLSLGCMPIEYKMRSKSSKKRAPSDGGHTKTKQKNIATDAKMKTQYPGDHIESPPSFPNMVDLL